MGELSAMPNIGKVLEQKLNETGIFTQAQLLALGSRDVFLRLRAKDPGACLSMLCALEGAIQGVRWHHLPDAQKAALKAFYSAL